MIKGTPEEIKAYKRANYLKNKEKNKEKNRLYKIEYRLKNKEKIQLQSKEYFKKLTDNKTSYYWKNRDKVLKYAKQYRNINYEKVKIGNADKQRKRRSKPENRLKENIRTRIRNSFKYGFTKKSKSAKILGCSFEEFKIYIESKFEFWMNWKNYGNWDGYPTKINHSWDLDHIIPISIASSEKDIIKLNHYTNFQPLCSYTNRHIKREKLL